MALYLSSRGAPGIERFLEYRAAGKRTCLIPTAANGLEDPELRASQFAQAHNALREAELEVEIIDLDDPEAGTVRFDDFHVVALGPGDPFYLLQQARAHNLEYRLRQAAAHGTVIVGIGAGAMVLGPTLDPVIEASRYAPADGAYLEGLYLTETLVLPHHNVERRAQAHAAIIERFGSQFPVVPLHDGQAVVISSDGTTLVGEPAVA
ncbi:MAG: Type 1 glutamine amidotransferase-like domain-containing protein [Dehalococcoidia bacterium]